MGVWTFQAQDMTIPNFSPSLCHSFVVSPNAVENPGSILRPRGRNSAMFTSQMNIIATMYSCVVFLPSDDYTLNNHLFDVPAVTTKQEPFQPPLRV